MPKKKQKTLYGMGQDELFAEFHSDIQREVFRDAPGRFRENDDDSEDFYTSEDIVKKDREIQASEGLKTLQEIEEEAVFKRFTTRRKHKYTEKEMEAIRESCLRTIVHDYGESDWYHISDEDRRRHDQLDEVGKMLEGLKRIYHRPDEWVTAMRVVYKAWGVLARKNFLHSREEFFELVSSGKIVSPRILMPILKKADKYNMEKLIMYISNPELDVSHLVPKNQNDKDAKGKYAYLDDDDDFFGIKGKKKSTVETYEEKCDRLLDEEELKYVTEYDEDNPDRMVVKPVEKRLIRGYDQRNRRKKDKKKLKKGERYEREQLATLMKNIQNGSHYKKQGASFMITHNLFEPEKVEKGFIEEARFEGSWQDDEAVKIYDLVLFEELMKQRLHKDRHMTYSDKLLDNFFNTLEDQGVNTVDLRRRMNMNPDRIERKRTEASKRENKKNEAKIIQRITELNGNKRFKKLINRAEDELNEYRKENW